MESSRKSAAARGGGFEHDAVTLVCCIRPGARPLLVSSRVKTPFRGRADNRRGVRHAPRATRRHRRYRPILRCGRLAAPCSARAIAPSRESSSRQSGLAFERFREQRRRDHRLVILPHQPVQLQQLEQRRRIPRPLAQLVVHGDGDLPLPPHSRRPPPNLVDILRNHPPAFLAG